MAEAVSGPGHQTAVEYAYSSIKAMVTRGELPVGERIDQDQLAATLGLSRMPIRTALQKLAAEGLVTVHPYRGAMVREFAPAELEELYLIRQELEGLALRLSGPLLTELDLAELERICTESEEAASRGDWQVTLACNQQFHFYAYRAATRPLLLEMLLNLWDKNNRYRSLFLRVPGRLHEAQSEHRSIVAHLRAGEFAAAEATLREHNERGRRTLLALFGYKIESGGGKS